MEKNPPRDPLHRRLWLMGLRKDERDRIIEVAIERFWDPVDLAHFVTMARASSIQEMAIRTRRLRPWARRLDHLLDAIRSALSRLIPLGQRRRSDNL